MQNFCGQNITLGHFVGQTVRTSNGTVHRVGVVLHQVDGENLGDPQQFIVAFWDPKSDLQIKELQVPADPLFRLAADTLASTIRRPLEFAYTRRTGRTSRG